MPTFSKVIAGGKAVSGGALSPRGRRGNTAQVAAYWSGGALAPVTAPTSLSSTVTTTTATISFTAPTNDGGSPITNYRYSFDNSSFTAFSPADATTPVVISGLTAGTAYTIYLQAVNEIGFGPASSGLSVTTQAALNVQYLVIAGGGGGTSEISGGGGAGGYRTSATGQTSGRNSSTESALALSVSTNYTVTVGGGGATGSNGSDSVFSTITSTGGARGVTYQQNGVSGGSGSGGGGYNAATTGGAGTANQGFDGGSNGGTNPRAAGGGGGAGGNGGTGGSGLGSIGGSRGAGLSNNITGTAVTRALGGKGGDMATPSSSQAAGGANTGDGGSGGGSYGEAGRAGGSGVVILKYPDSYTITIGAGLTGSTAGASGGFKVSTVTAGTGNVSFA